MALFSVPPPKPLLFGALVSLTAVALTACGSDDEAVPEQPPEPQEVFNIGVTLSSPGLISGVEPTEVAGLEVELATALMQQLETVPAQADIRWVPVNRDHLTEAFAAQELDLVIGQLPGPELTPEISWVGPYLTTEAGLLTFREPTDETVETTPAERLESLEALDDLADATVCVVADSLSDVDELPAAGTVVQTTVTECEIGMRSGRYDAVAADTIQLAGFLTDPLAAGDYELVPWSELQPDDAADADADDEPALQVSEELLETGAYWIGVSDDYCSDTSAGLRQLVADGAVADLVAQWADPIDVQPQVVSVAELTTPECTTAS